MQRLRLALDSPGARDWLRDYRAGNRLYFGRYTGQTPIPGERRSRGRRFNELRNVLSKMTMTANNVCDDVDKRYFFPAGRWGGDADALGYARLSTRHPDYQLQHVEYHADARA